MSTSLALIDGARGGDRDALDRLVAAVWPDAYRLAYAMLGARDAAEDAAQEACIALARGLGSLRSAEAFRTWFARIVVREASAVKRHAARFAPTRDERAEAYDAATAIDIWTALGTLPAPLRTVVVLRYFEDLTSRDIGAVLGIPSPTVRFRLMIALRRLRPLLDDSAASPMSEVRTHAC